MNIIPDSPILCACGCGRPVLQPSNGKHWRFCKGHKSRPVPPPSAPGLKRCTRCGTDKPLDAFHRRADQADGHATICIECEHTYKRQYRVEHADTVKASKAAWGRANRERLNARARANREAMYQRQKRWRAANRDRRNAVERAWRAANPDKTLKAAHNWREKNKAAWTAYNAQWRKLHPGKVREATRRRSLRKKGQAVGKVDYAAILARDGYTCHICGGAVEPKDVQFDHIMPLAKGGAHSMENIAVAHGACNRRKGAKILHRSTLKL